ncbi:SCP2 sterol-binding domain-containing protein [Phototrophicus methaneseepsis]|uniref:SCP2 sterol-binding domain-containing protein n=1 Tax=Phototrophicus methaneseepsis TaxID=2710758 RepID=A0A7S8E6I8_9CHLR|nr:SCP2 sterol-binding domain-containing protein [Phototrophicus methaneseepsis]QPC81229.1 SCP2 sterol-binding domain-containing protein [Phototrophicus methaneseepsis]
MPTQEEIAAVFPEMMARFQPEKAEGTNVTIQFDLSGDNGGLYWVTIADGTAEYGEGSKEADMTVKASADDFYALVNGDLNPMQAVMFGKVKVSDVGLGMKMMSIFNLG